MAEPQLVDIDGKRLRLTNLDKIMYPEARMTKGEVIEYYAAVAPNMIPLMMGRPITRKRWVHGVGTAAKEQSFFFEKHLVDHAPEWLQRSVIHHSDGDKTYPIANDRAALVWLGQQAALELHVPQWRFQPDGTPANPDRMVFDLDPGPGVGLIECAEVARMVRAILNDMGLEAAPVTSGSKGIHLYARLDGTQTSDQAAAVARELARALETDHPDLVVSNMRKSEREGRVFIDWSQNNGKKTTISPYSLRGLSRPTVAAPRSWDELTDPGLRQLEAGEVLARISDAAGLPITVMAAPGLLAPYLAKRTLGATPEPMPAVVSSRELSGDLVGGGSRFVIQEHHARRLHYDLRLERDGVLKSWAVPKGVPLTAGVNHLAVQTEDHPIEYLSFHGMIPKGEYGAGEMTIWDTGTFDLEKWRDDEIIFTLRGLTAGRLGMVRVALIRTDGEGEKSSWLLHRMKQQDLSSNQHASSTRSPVKSASSTRPLAKSIEPPSKGGESPSKNHRFWEPMLATPATIGLVGDDRTIEWKWDGVRAIARVNHTGKTELRSRNGRDITAVYPEFVGLGEALPDVVVDGEIVVLDEDGRPDFGLLQHRMNLVDKHEIVRAAEHFPARLLLFDVLEYAGSPIITQTHTQRRELLIELFSTVPGLPVEVPGVAQLSAAAALAEARALGIEGIIAKRPNSPYRPGARSDDWLKLKVTKTQDVVIGGYRRAADPRAKPGIRSLLLGVQTPEGLAYVGRVGSGFTQRTLATLADSFNGLEIVRSPFVEVPVADAADAVWLQPKLVGEVEFSDWTRTGILRHARWRGIRSEIAPESVSRHG